MIDHLDEHSSAFRSPEVFHGDDYDPVIDAYKKDVDRTLLRENLKLTPAERIAKFQSAMRSVYELRRSARTRRGLAS